MKTEFTTNELIKISKVDPKTFPAWVRKGWVPPFEAGRGRGHQNIFDRYRVAWSVTLKEIFLIWPKASCPVYLFNDWLGNKAEKDRWTPCKLSDGKAILNYLRTPQPIMPPHEMVVDLSTGFLGLPGITKPNRRFAEIRIRPAKRFLSLIENWLSQTHPYTTISTGKEAKQTGTVRCAAVINLSQIFDYVDFMAAKL